MNFRIKRLASQFREEITQIIQHEIKDPRVLEHFVTITDVEVFQDLTQAKVFVSIIDEHKFKVLEGLNHTSGFIRSILGKRLSLRKIPKLDFFLDDTPESAARMIKKIEEIKEREEWEKKKSEEEQ